MAPSVRTRPEPRSPHSDGNLPPFLQRLDFFDGGTALATAPANGYLLYADAGPDQGQATA
jgi:hypothetical protein